jgi:LAO/AO transport system kinase
VPAPDITNLLQCIRAAEPGALARGITLVENDLPGAQELLSSLQHTAVPKVVGITGPPGAGKSTLVNSLLAEWTNAGKKVAVLAVDPSSPFHFGSLLGDRIRMARFYNNPDVFIRSLASRGSLGGLHARIFEIADVVKEAGFDIIVIETVGVGQSEVEIAGLADCTVVTLVPEAGDTIQTMKAGLLEIADIFVVNKADRPEADKLYQSLRVLAHEQANDEAETPVLKTVASTSYGTSELAGILDSLLRCPSPSHIRRHQHLLLEKVYRLIQNERMAGISKTGLAAALDHAKAMKGFNIYSFARNIAASNTAVPQS